MPKTDAETSNVTNPKMTNEVSKFHLAVKVHWSPAECGFLSSGGGRLASIFKSSISTVGYMQDAAARETDLGW